ncbi:MAG: HD-GYP domain-containing protein [Clostridiaceae bacterium]|jgi:putative nucleotidyltransferase with HDIG domain|nr:HD-GYP domain-containing protein [Clostridiaceae bacterium]
MKVINLPSSILKPGMAVYEDVYNPIGVLILNKDTILDRWQIEKIYANNVDKVRVKLTEDDRLYAVQEEEIASIYDLRKIRNFKEKYTAKVDEVTHIIKEIGRGAAVDVQAVNQISRHIIKEFSTVSEVINYLHLARPLDDYTYSHSLNVSLMSIIIAKWLKLSDKETDEIATAGLLHDIGKTKISEKLLLKPGRLTNSEYEEIKKHTILGYMMMDNIKDATENIKYSVLMHHEKIDGSGYPIGASDENIPLFSKIIAIADIYDAMTSNRSYRNRMCPFEVIKNFEMQTFGKLDTRVLTVFLKNIANSYINDFVELNSGEMCEIVFINPNRIWQPIVRFGTDFIDLSRDNDKRFIKTII